MWISECELDRVLYLLQRCTWKASVFGVQVCLHCPLVHRQRSLCRQDNVEHITSAQQQQLGLPSHLFPLVLPVLF